MSAFSGDSFRTSPVCDLLKVKVENAVIADEISTTLMGDQVEFRKNFI